MNRRHTIGTGTRAHPGGSTAASVLVLAAALLAVLLPTGRPASAAELTGPPDAEGYWARCNIVIYYGPGQTSLKVGQTRYTFSCNGAPGNGQGADYQFRFTTSTYGPVAAQQSLTAAIPGEPGRYRDDRFFNASSVIDGAVFTGLDICWFKARGTGGTDLINRNCKVESFAAVPGTGQPPPYPADWYPGGTPPPWVTDPSTSFGDRESAAYDGDPVNVATGNYTEAAVDLGFPATVAGLDWTRTYNSRDTATTALGRGWTPGFGARVATAADGKVTLTEDDGRRLVFVPNGVGGFLRPPEFRGDLVTQPDGTRRVVYFDGRTDRFDASGRLVQRSFWDGQSVALAYSGANLATATHSTGRSLAFAWTGSRLTGVTADDGRSATYAYDGDGDLATVAVTDGGTTTYATDAAGRVTKVTDPDGVEVIANVYGPQDRVVSQTTASGDTVTFAYDDALGRTTVARAGSGASVVYDYDHQGRVTKVTDPFGEVVTKTWDAQGRLTSVVDRRGGTVTTTYDAHGNPLTRSEPEGVSLSFTWDASDRLTSATNGESETTTFSYDGAERIPAAVTDPEGGVTTFDVVAGLVESVTDADGVALDLAWDADRNLTGVTDEDSETTTFAYDAAGNRTSTGTPLGHTTTWAWDGRRRVTSTTDAEGATRAWTWSPGGRPLTATDAEGHDTDHSYDDAGRLAAVTDALGEATTLGYDADGNLVSVTRPGGAVATATFDKLGRRLSETDPTDVTTAYAYDEDGNLTTTTDEAGKTVTRAYDLRGRVTKVTDQLGEDTDLVWDDADRLTSVTDALGGVTSYAWDDAGRLLTRTMPDGGTWSQSWTPAGRLDTETDPNGHVTDHAYDDVGRLDAVTDPLGHVTDHEWDADGRLTSLTTPEGLTTAFTWDGTGRLLTTTAPNGGVTSRTWTPRGQLDSLDPPATAPRSFLYDALGRLVTATAADGGDTDWTYDDRGNPLTRTDAKGGVEQYTWDDADRLLTRTDALTRTTTQTWDALGRLATVADPSGRSVALAYDDAGRVLSRTFTQTGGGTTTVSHAYDALGRRTSTTDATGTTTYGWDPVSRPASVAYPSGKTLGFAWDDAGNRTGLTYPDGTTATFAYDAADRLTGLAHPQAPGGVAYTHDDDGRLLTEALPGSVSRSYSWTDGLLAGYTEARPEGTRTTTLTRDAAGRVDTETTGGVTTDYGYDPAGQLESVTRGSQTTTYAYDAAGNRTSRTRGAVQTLYAHDAAHQLTQAVRKVAGTTVETVAFAHDGAGRLTSATGTAGSRTLSYDPRGVLASVTTALAGSGVTTTARTTDGDGTLVAATTTAPGGTRSTGLTWDPSLVVPQVATTSTGGADVNHLYGTGRALALRGGQSDTYAQDAHGSALPIGEAADLARAEGYDEFGLPSSEAPRSLLEETAGLTADGGDAATLFGYRGETHLDGLLHLRAREYAPGLGRFTTVDPLPGIAGEVTVASPYPYAANDPVDMVDPLGLRPLADSAFRSGCTAGTSPHSSYDKANPAGTLGCGSGLPWRAVVEALGFIPIFGDVVDGGLCVGSVATKNYGDAAFDCIAIIPFAGSFARVGKHGDEFVDLTTDARRTHILDGDATGGGHRWPGKPTKTPFPPEWSADRILHEVADVATDPRSARATAGGRTIVTGTRAGVDLRVVIDDHTGEILTAYPTNLPRNP